MPKTILAAFTFLVVTTGPARADILPVTSNVPPTYMPGVPFSFEVRAPGLIDLFEFDITLTIETPVSDPAIALTTVVSRPAPAAYVFGASGEFEATPFDNFGSTALEVSITGLATSGVVNTVAGQNDQLALVTVTPNAAFDEPIAFRLEVNMFSVNSELVFDPLPPFVVNSAVPAPAGWVMLGVGGLALAARRRR